eukprot:scpid110754/ scgid30731/ 
MGHTLTAAHALTSPHALCKQDNNAYWPESISKRMQLWLWVVRDVPPSLHNPPASHPALMHSLSLSFLPAYPFVLHLFQSLLLLLSLFNNGVALHNMNNSQISAPVMYNAGN